MESDNYYVRFRGQVTGPYTHDQLIARARAGQISAVHSISADKTTWTMAKSYGWLFSANPTAVPVTQAVPAAQMPSLASLFSGQGDSRDSARTTPAALVGSPGQIYAGFWRRFGAIVVDSVVLFSVWFVLLFIVAFLFSAFVHNDPSMSGALRALVVGLLGSTFGNGLAVTPVGTSVNLGACAVTWLYFAFFESSSFQGTPGKIAVGIRVIRIEGGSLTFGQATGRHFAKFISAIVFYVGFFMAGWTEKRQTLHDMMAGCLVTNR